MKYINCILLLLLFTMLISCSKEPTYYSHTKVFVPSVKSDSYKCPIDSDAFDVTAVIHLELPDESVDVKGIPLFCNDRIYIYDVKREYVLVFDKDGQFIHKVGGLGRAKNEINGSICTFDVDRHTNYVHIYNREGRKILVYDENGKFVSCVMLRDCLPSSIVISENGSYIASFDCMSYTDKLSRLVILDAKGKISKILLESEDENNITCEGVNTRPLFSDHKGHITYLSTLADSVAFISGDTIQEIYNMEFADGFLSEKEIKKAKQSGVISDQFSNTQYISQCHITDDYLLMEFYGKKDGITSNYTYLLNKNTGKDYVFSGYVCVPGVLNHVCTILNDELIVIVKEEDALQYELVYKNYYDSSSTTYDEMVKELDLIPVCEDVLLHKIKTPVILKLKLR